MSRLNMTLACWVMVATPLSAVAADGFSQRKNDNWHQWRGPEANGVGPRANPPVTWSDKRNIRWKTPIVGQGSSAPIIWGDQIFLLSAVKTDKVDPKLPRPEDQPKRPFGITFPNAVHQYAVICLDRETGRERWRKIAIEKVPHSGHHGDNNFASASPTTDGQRLYVWFGSAGLYCYDLSGELLWQRDLGAVPTRLSFGEGCSPVVYGDRLVINRDHEDSSTIYVLDTKSGEIQWQADRDESSAWATPIVVEHQGVTQVITNASNFVRSYNLADGALLWQCSGQVSNVIPSPVSQKGIVYCMSGYRGAALFALPLDARGDISGSEKIAWSHDRGTPYIPSPLLYDGYLYFNQSNNAIMTCLNAETGATLIERTRMPAISRIYASPVGAAGRVYFVGRDGTTLVIERGATFKVLATNSLGEGVDASPAVVGDALFLRGKKHIYRISEKKKP